jgi:hypothetical protein
MDLENWHTSFNPQKFLSRVNLDKLIEHNEAYNESKVDQGSTPCILCSSIQGPGILLNDKSYLCRECFSDVSAIQYPQVYEDARRKYLKETESRRIALEEFTNKYGYKIVGNPATVFAWLSLLLLFVHFGMIIVPVILFLVSSSIDLAQEKKQNAWLKLKEEWEKGFPEPTAPILRHFHDPQIRLTDRDRKILKIFNNWPGYPPFWNYLREVVLSRDGNHCQVSGCPSRVTLHVHHKTPVAKGGEHIPDNLVSLCDFHHALEPDEGHERIWGSIKTRYFTIVRAHERQNRASTGYHNVSAHVRRLELVNADELNQIRRFHSLSCPECGSENISISVREKVEINCEACNKKWSGPKELTEETGPRLAELLSVRRNRGIWKPRWDMLSSRTSNVFSSLSTVKKARSTGKKRQTIKSVQAEENPLCPKCGSPMKLITPKPGQRWKKFWGCTKYWSTGCKGSQKA